jgi:23S rRNA (uracil1939-C5)-methyltransferase
MSTKIEKDNIYEVDIHDNAHEGQGVGKIDGLTVFVEGALLGERVMAKVDKVTKNYAIAHTEKVLKPSLERIKPKCPYAEKCGGCMLQHLSYEGQLRFKTQKVKNSLKRIGKINTTVLETIGMKEPWQYRNKAQYPVGEDRGQAIMGFYEKRTHKIVPSDTCIIQHGVNTRISRAIKKWIYKYRIPIYNEVSHKGLLRHVVTKVGFKTKEVMIVLVANGRKIPHVQELINELEKSVPCFKSLILNINEKKTNVIMGTENITLYGFPYIYDYIGDIKFGLSALSFFQVNPVQVEVLYNKALEFANLTGNETVVDTYCGIGTITLFLARKAKSVYGIEIVLEAIEDAKRNAKLNGINNVEFIAGAAEKVLPDLYEKGVKPDVIVMDPPRRGCDEKLLQTVVDMKPARVVYVSCNPATLARDLRFLEDRGFKTEVVQPVDMFPHTHHVECIVQIKRAASRMA